jgi:hypothetical protein
MDGSGPFLHLEYAVGHEPVGFPVYPRCGVSVGRLHQAEDLALLVVDPVQTDRFGISWLVNISGPAAS